MNDGDYVAATRRIASFARQRTPVDCKERTRVRREAAKRMIRARVKKLYIEVRKEKEKAREQVTKAPSSSVKESWEKLKLEGNSLSEGLDNSWTKQCATNPLSVGKGHITRNLQCCASHHYDRQFAVTLFMPSKAPAVSCFDQSTVKPMPRNKF